VQKAVFSGVFLGVRHFEHNEAVATASSQGEANNLNAFMI
jgi:hypothetical protein